MINPTNFNQNNSWWTGGGLPAGNNNATGGTGNTTGGAGGGSQAAGTAMLNLRRTADLLQSSLNFMRGIGSQNASSPFRSNSAVSSDTDILQLTATDSRRLHSSSLANRDFSVEVLQLAQAQRNEGNALDSNALATAAGFEVGNHHISITVDGRQFDFNFSVSATDTAREVQERIASAVNVRNTGVTASVSRNAEDGTSTLVFASADTGANNDDGPNFTVGSSSGNALSVVGGRNITQQAQNAEFRVNRGFTGALQTSRTNDVNLGFGVEATLRELGEVEVTMDRNETGQINAFRHMVNAFNDLADAARSSPRLQQQLSQFARSHGASLNRLGVSVNSSGRMQIDEDRMERAAERGDLESFVNRDRVGGNSGFFNRLNRIATDAARNPGNFVMDDNTENPFFGVNPRMLSHANQMAGIGMLFDNFI